MNKRFTVGLTGGIASGKSMVADWLHALGAAIVDTDLMAREVTEAGSPALAEISLQLGQDLIAADGTLDRPRLRSLIFSDPLVRTRLEALLHPRIRKAAWERAAATPGSYLVMVIPLLAETGFTAGIDRVLVVDAPRELQLKRLRARDGATYREARAIIAAQATRRLRRSLAHDVLMNDGTPEALRQQVEKLHHAYLLQAGNPNGETSSIAG